MTANLDAIFGALADPTRRRIMERLARRPLTVGEIASGFTLTQPAISKHVRVLEQSGLLDRTIEGRLHYCSISTQTMQEVQQWMDRQRKYWNGSLDRLEALLQKSERKK